MKNRDPNETNTDENSHKIIFIYQIGDVTVKDFSYTTIIIVNLSYLITNRINGCI